MKTGKRALKQEATKQSSDEKPNNKPVTEDKLQPHDSSFSRIDSLQQELLKHLEQDRLQRRELFQFELTMIFASWIFFVVILIGNYSWGLQLGVITAMCYIIRKIIKDITKKF